VEEGEAAARRAQAEELRRRSEQERAAREQRAREEEEARRAAAARDAQALASAEAEQDRRIDAVIAGDLADRGIEPTQFAIKRERKARGANRPTGGFVEW
jgi:hypothetical protein